LAADVFGWFINQRRRAGAPAECVQDTSARSLGLDLSP
jgi:hypothetical protein